jgi:exodeoxyribonuclease-3
MKVISFNVNSLRMRQHQMEALLEENADVIGLQETKVTDEQFPLEMVHDLGYEAFYHGQKTHYGVAILVKKSLVEADPTIVDSVIKGFADEAEDHQRRFIGIKVNGVTILNGYFPQGESRSHPTKFPAKQAFYSRLQMLLETQFTNDMPIVVMGDMNISPEDQDIGIGEDNAKRWLRTGKCSLIPEEREWYQKLYDCGLEDSYLLYYPEDDSALI